MPVATQEQLNSAVWVESRQSWELRGEGGERVAAIPGDRLPGGEHPRHYTPEELAADIAWCDGE